MTFNSIRLLAAAAAFALAGTAASAATTTTFNFATGNGTYDAAAKAFTFSSGGLTLVTTGHLLNSDGTIGQLENIGQYSNGLGVTNYKDKSCFLWCTYTDEHYVDSTGSDEVIKFSFSEKVSLTQITFKYVDSSDDFSFSLYDGATLASYDSTIDISGHGYGWYNFGTPTMASTMFGIGAAGSGDEFKVKSITVKWNDVPAIPLPASGLLLIGALGGLGLARKRRKAA